MSAWGSEQFEISYKLYDFNIVVRSKKSKSGPTIEIIYPEIYDKMIEELRRDMKKYQEEDGDGYFRIIKVNGQERYVDVSPSSLMIDIASKNLYEDYSTINYFVPAGRSFFSTLQGNVFSFISTSIDMDPFLIEFGRLYERMRNTYSNSMKRMNTSAARENKELFSRIIKGSYIRENNNDYILSSGDRSVPIGSTSSGQQEALPLLILLSNLGRNRSRLGINLFIEEPEAHLFPDTQKDFIDYIFSSLFTNRGICIVTTHSPYILSEINNMMYRGYMIKVYPSSKRVDILKSEAWVDPSRVEAYHFSDGAVNRIIDPETGLIDASSIDKVSGVISEDFDKLISIESELLNV